MPLMRSRYMKIGHQPEVVLVLFIRLGVRRMIPTFLGYM